MDVMDERMTFPSPQHGKKNTKQKPNQRKKTHTQIWIVFFMCVFVSVLTMTWEANESETRG